MKKLFLLILSALLLCILTGCGTSGQASETEETQAEVRSFGGYLLYHPENTDEAIRINAVRIDGDPYYFLPSPADIGTLDFGDADVSGLPETLEPGVAYPVTINRRDYHLIRSAGTDALFLELDEALSYLDESKNRQATGSAWYLNADGTAANAREETVEKLNGRGNASWGVVKKGYNFKLAESAHWIGNGTTRSYTLVANYDDGSLLRNKIGLDLANELRVGPGAAEMVDLFVNGLYHGSYILTPKTTASAPKTGYMLELDNNADENQFVLDHWSSRDYISAFTVKDNDAEVPLSDIRDYMQEVWDAIRDTESDEYLSYIDIDSFAKHFLIQEFCKDGDPLSGSIFMYRCGTEPEDKLYMGPIWDLAYSMGRIFYNGRGHIHGKDISSADGWYLENVDDATTNLFAVLLEHDSFREAVRDTWADYADLFEALPGNIDRAKERYAVSARLNYLYWDIDHDDMNLYITGGKTVDSGPYAVEYIRTETWEDYVANFRAYTAARVKFLCENAPRIADENAD